MPKRVPLRIAPGITHSEDETGLATPRWSGGKNAVFYRGKLKKSPGWAAVSLGSSTITGVARWAFGFYQESGNKEHSIIGTEQKLYDLVGNTLTNVTPLTTGTTALPNNPVGVSSGSPTVTITVSAAGDMPEEVGARVKLAGLTDTGGILAAALNKEHIVTARPTSTTFQFTASSNASSTATGGGASGTIQNEIADGEVSNSAGYGFGYGLFGAGLFGAAASSTATTPPRIWSGDRYGDEVVLTPGGSSPVYKWGGDTTVAPAVLSGAPTDVDWVFVSNDIVVTLAGRRIKWSDRGGYTTWSAAATNQAGADTIEGASGDFLSAASANGVNLLFTYDQVWKFQYIGGAAIWDTEMLTGEDGIIGPRAYVVHGGVIYFMGGLDWYRYYGGRVEPIPGASPKRYVYGRLDRSQANKSFAAVFPGSNLIRFYYPGPDDNGEPACFVDYDPFSGIWWTSEEQDRTCFQLGQSFDYPRLISSTGTVYEHENGVDDNGSAMEWYAETKWFQIAEGDNVYYVRTLHLDATQTGSIQITLYGKANAQTSEVMTAGPYTVAADTGRLDVRLRGRLMKIRIEGVGTGSDYLEGDNYMEIVVGAGR